MPRSAAGARVVGEHVLGLVELALAGGVDLVALGRGLRADLLGFGRGLGGDLLRFGEARRRLLLGIGLGGEAQALALGLARAPIRSISLRRSAISRSRAVKACSSACMALARTASDAAIAEERSCVFLAISIAFWISAISTFLSLSIAELAQVAVA